MAKSVVIYYSLTNNVANLVKSLPNEMAEIYRLESVIKIPKSSVLSLILAGFLATFNKPIKSKALTINLASYDKIILASPLWVGKISPVLRGFIVDNKSVLSNKTTAVVVVNGGSPLDSCQADLATILASQKFFGINKRKAKTAEGLASFKTFVAELGK